MTSIASAQARVTQRICEAIKGQIASGLLGPGARLPSTRSLAAEWGVSRTTVTAAYEQLIAEGYLETRQGARAQVARGLTPPAAPQEPPAPSGVPDRLSGYGQRLADFTPSPRSDREWFATDFRYGDGGRRLPPARLEEGGHHCPAAQPAKPSLRRPVRLG